MAKKISHEDGRAIDLLLDRAGTVARSSDVKSAKSSIRPRLAAAERVLRLLDQMPAMEPPADLVQRTLARIDEAPIRIHPRAAQSHRTALHGDSQSHA